MKTSDFAHEMEIWSFRACASVFFTARAQNDHNSTSCLKSDVTVAFLDPDLLLDANVDTSAPLEYLI